jgi:hypothetical protein
VAELPPQPALYLINGTNLLKVGNMILLDSWSKVAECERAMAVVADPERRIVLNSLKELWIALGNRQSWLDRPERAAQLRTIVEIHAQLMWGCRAAMH